MYLYFYSYLCTHKSFTIMKALIIITLVLLVEAIVAFAIVICGLSRKADDFYTELELTKELVSIVDRRSPP